MSDHRNRDRPPVPPQACRNIPTSGSAISTRNHLAGQNVGERSEAATRADRTALHLGKSGYEPRGMEDDDLKQVPVLAPGTRLIGEEKPPQR